MTYRIARNGQTFGPYTEVEMRQYIASGNIGLSDFVQAEGADSWVPVGQLFPPAQGFTARPPSPGVAPPTLYPDPPDFPWWGALLLGLVTGGLFFTVWDIVQASWMRRVERQSSAFLLYIGVAVLYFFKLPGLLSTVSLGVLDGVEGHHFGKGTSAAWVVLLLIARWVFRRELLEHFERREGIPLTLGPVMASIFGGLYFQYKFNKINEVKRAMARSVPAA